MRGQDIGNTLGSRHRQHLKIANHLSILTSHFSRRFLRSWAIGYWLLAISLYKTPDGWE
jgi:hypothetical protein